MNKTAYIFNPEHDLALAFGGENYTAPPLAQCLRHDLQMLPIWFAEAGCSILSQNAEKDNRWIEQINSRYGITAKAISEIELQHQSHFIPWGWDLDIRKRLITMGANSDSLPSSNAIIKMRELSHRRTSIMLHRQLCALCGTEFSPIPIELDNFNDIHRFATKHTCAYIKSPWSSSGKGIFRALEPEAIEFERWCRGILRRQGSMICEVPLDGVLDFAMEFSCSRGKSSFLGYSVFKNDFHSSFDHGIILPTKELYRHITSALGDETIINNVQNALIDILDREIAPYYQGYLGIDMLLYRDSKGQTRLNPCIELNLRPTMGVVSSIIGDRFISKSAHGIFKIEYHKEPVTQAHLHTLEQISPETVISDGKMASGFQLLAPCYDNSRYCAYMIVEKD